jgi:hypothetical protein
MLKVILAKSAQCAQDTLEEFSDIEWVTIETEYGDKAVSGDLSLNHHGELQAMDAPSLAYKLNLKKRYDNFLISHIDLDVLFGILWAAGWLKKTTLTIGLSNLVAIADVNGFHTIKPLLETMSNDVKERYYAIGYLVNSWVINDNGMLKKDISKEIHKLALRIKDIILSGATPEQIAQYEQWFIEQDKVAKQYLQEIYNISSDEKMFIFRAPFSLTNAYSVGDYLASVIVQYNEQSKSISLSCFDIKVAQKYFGDSGVIEPMQKYFGPDAGGKNTIAGTSRSHNIQPEMVDGFIKFLHREYFNTPEMQVVTDTEEQSSRRLLALSKQELLKTYSCFDISSLMRPKE